MDGIRRLADSFARSTREVSHRLRRQRDVMVCALALLAALALTIAGLATPSARAADETDPHAHHHHMMASPDTTRTLADYVVPDVTLVRDDGRSVALRSEIDDGRPVVLSFIYTTCTTICPVTSMTLSELQRKLGDARDSVHLVSISIDPEQDTPARLRDYAKKFGAGPEWQHYTGTVEASVASQRAFAAYRGNKMDHAPVTLVRLRPGERWTRIDGFATADQLLAELNGGVAGKVAAMTSR
jgi:protein SCO1/2